MYGPPTMRQWQASHADKIVADACAAAERDNPQMLTYSPWTETGPDGVTYGFGARDWRGNRWAYQGTVGGEVTRTLVRAAGEQTMAESLRAAADAVLKGQNHTTDEDRAWAQQCLNRAKELEASASAK